MGYPTIVFPGTHGGSDVIQLQKLNSDLKAGELGVFAGTVAPDLKIDEIKIEYIGFEFDNPLTSDAAPDSSSSSAPIKWILTLEDMVDFKKMNGFLKSRLRIRMLTGNVLLWVCLLLRNFLWNIISILQFILNICF